MLVFFNPINKKQKNLCDRMKKSYLKTNGTSIIWLFLFVGIIGNIPYQGGEITPTVTIEAPKTADLSININLSYSNASFIGEANLDYSGTSIAGAGDVNGDGFDDVLVGAYNSNESFGSYPGQTYLILGKAAGWAMDTNLSNADASFIGEADYDYSGWSVAGAGDVNGDSFDDILVGVNQNDEGGNNAGQTYLILGKASGWAMDTNLSSADASFIGEFSSDGSGISVAGAGDVNGDDIDDILVGACGNDGGGSRAGQTYLIFGRTSGWKMDLSLSGSNASFRGEFSNDESGKSVAGAGDVNGDGFDDILVGAHESDEGGIDVGQTYLILGKASGWAMDVSLSSSNASFIGEADSDFSGSFIAGAGDVNGDDFDDILVGASHNGEGGMDAGQTYLIFGKTSGWAMDTNLTNADASFIGEAYDDNSGSSVAGAGDVNEDGFDDVLVGAYFNDEGDGDDAGQTYLILGKASGWAMDTILSSVDASFIGEANADWSGTSVAGVGDVNGDGIDDIFIGAYGNDEGDGVDAGQTYLIFGVSINHEEDSEIYVPGYSYLMLATIAAISVLYLFKKRKILVIRRNER